MQGRNTSRRFWWINLVPWLAYLLLNLLLMSSFVGFISGVVLVSTGLSVALYLVSGATRHTALRRGWLELELPALAWRMVLCVLVGGLAVQIAVGALMAVAQALHWVTLPGANTTLGAVLMYWFNTCIMLALWATGWIGWRALRHAREARIARLEAEAQRHQLERDALRARLNPHFVFNALNNLRALILEDPQRARELVGRLSNTLRHALEHSQHETVPLTRELAVVEDYLAVEGVHYEGRLRVSSHIDPAARDALLPPMALQLLVENAIKHGIAVTPGGGELQIVAKRTPDALRLTVENPGYLGKSRAGHGVGLAYLRQGLVRVAGRFVLEQQGPTVRATLEIPQ